MIARHHEQYLIARYVSVVTRRVYDDALRAVEYPRSRELGGVLPAQFVLEELV